MSKSSNNKPVAFGEKFFNLLSLLVLLSFSWLLWKDLSPYWFHPDWTTDDALQQVYPFHRVFRPELFSGDLITEVMEGYLAPLHYWISWSLTWLIGDPIMMSHWLTLIQIGLACLFLFLIIRNQTNFAFACLAVTWLLHTRTIVQRMVGGLPRCWAMAILLATLYFVLKKNHKAVLLILLLGCLLNPPATLVAAAGYGLFLLIAVLRKQSRAAYLRPLLVLLLLSPVYAGSVLLVIKRSPQVGQMVSFEEASKLPEFQRPHGRFPFLPLDSRSYEYRIYGYQPFKHRLFDIDRYLLSGLGWNFWPKNFFRVVTFPILLIGLAFLLWRGAKRGRWAVPLEILAYVLAVVCVYELSRLLAFKLYVPNRHLQAPMSVFWLTAIPIAIYRVFESLRARVAAVLVLAGFVVILSGHSFYGTANFNYPRLKRGHVFEWVRKHTPENALIAGHPTHIDPVQLFGERIGYATTETAHPFYGEYFKEIKRRLELSLKAHYARDLREVSDLLAGEGVDYFIFSRMRFYPEALQKEDYFEPLNGLVKELVSYNPADYAFKDLPKEVNPEVFPFVVFRDPYSVVVDVQALARHYSQGGSNVAAD